MTRFPVTKTPPRDDPHGHGNQITRDTRDITRDITRNAGPRDRVTSSLREVTQRHAITGGGGARPLGRGCRVDPMEGEHRIEAGRRIRLRGSR